jgi:hypothetical protein
MVQRVDYFTLLSRAVESLERDAYAARGAIYDREHKALLKRLISSVAPCTDEDIAREEQAFRNAVRRIEFPGHEHPPARSTRREVDDPVPVARSPQREPAEAAWPSSSRDRVRAQRREVRAEPPQPQDLDVEANDGRRRRAPPFPQVAGEPRGAPLPQDELDRGQAEPKPRSRSLLRLTAAYLAVTALALGAGILGYAYLVGAVNVSWLNRWTWVTEWTGVAAPSSSARAVLYEASQPGRTGARVEGKAVWGTRSEPNGPDGKLDTVLTLEVEIPDPHLMMSMVLSRNLEPGAGMSHLIELRFAKPQQLPFGGISKISNIAMRRTENEGGDALGGTGVDIAPGQFMFGLLGLQGLAQQNLQRLRNEGWLAISIVFANGAAYTLVVEKGAAGERVIDDVLAKWGQ